MRILGGVVFSLIISAMKFEVMPIMAMRQMAWRTRTILNVAARAPWLLSAIAGRARKKFVTRMVWNWPVGDRKV